MKLDAAMPRLRHRMLVAAAGAALTTGAAAGQAGVRTFEADTPGEPPAGFTLAALRQPTAGVWQVVRQPDQAYLRHASDSAAAGYALALSADDPMRDAVVATRLRLAGGARTGGLVWRYQDQHNFYAALLDLGRGVVAMHRFVDGNRITIARRANLELDPDAWHVLKVVHDDSSVYVSLGGIRVINERDRRLDRFGPGRVGLVATGDSEAWFDDLRVERPHGRR